MKGVWSVRLFSCRSKSVYTGVWNVFRWWLVLKLRQKGTRKWPTVSCLLCRSLSPFAPFCLSSFILYPTTQAPKGVLCWPQGLSFTVVLSRWGSRLFTSCIKLHAIREIIALCEEELSQAFRIEEDLCFFLEPSFLNSTLVLKQITPGLSNDQKWVGWNSCMSPGSLHSRGYGFNHVCDIAGYTALVLLYPLSVLRCSSVLVIFFVLKSF